MTEKKNIIDDAHEDLDNAAEHVDTWVERNNKVIRIGIAVVFALTLAFVIWKVLQ